MVEDTINEINNELRKIVSAGLGMKSTKETSDWIKLQIKAYLISVSEVMGYVNLPKVTAEREGSFMAVNFLDDKDKRLETVGDLIYYMDTGINNGGQK